MNVPPSVSYALGALLIVFGVLRAYFLGWKHRPSGVPKVEGPGEGAGEGEAEGAGERAPARKDDSYKRHIRFGIIWVAMGLFVVISAALAARRGR
jgi:hypothetical protein